MLDDKLKLYFGYSDTDAEDVFAAGSSTQGSNYGKYPTFNNQFYPNFVLSLLYGVLVKEW